MNIPKTTFRFIFHFVQEQWFKFTILAMISMVWALNETIFPHFIKRMVDILQFFTGPRTEVFAAVKGVLILLVLFWCVSELMQRLQGILQIYVFPRFRASIRESVFNYVQAHSHEYFTSNFAGNIAKKIADLPVSCQAVMEVICFNFVTALVGTVMVLVMMWFTQPLFSVILMIWLMIHLGLTALLLRHGNILWEKHSDSVATLSGKIIDAFTNMLNVRLFSRAKYELRYLKKYQAEEIQRAKKAMWIMELTRIGLGLNGLFLIFGMIFLLLYSWAHEQITLGDFTQVGMQSFWILGWIWFVSYQLMIFARETGTIANSLKLIRKGHDVVDKKNAYPIKIKKGDINFKEVTFAYQKNRPVFKKLNVMIPAGQKVGLVGFSGSGKSTFVNLILRFYDVQSGHIMIDREDIADVTQESLRSQVAMIPQDPSLFHRSLMENIRYGRLDATSEEVVHAAKLAHCHEFIEKIDNTYQALVGERGIKLSGGQRQRIAIARAILKNAPILILDEATSSLDSVTEKLIQESLLCLMQGRTTIVVAHRLSTLTTMDRILVFDQGRIVEDGTKKDLLKAGGHFAKLWNMQTDGFLPNEKN